MASKNTDKETAQAATDKAPAKAAAPLLSLSELASMHRVPRGFRQASAVSWTGPQTRR